MADTNTTPKTSFKDKVMENVNGVVNKITGWYLARSAKKTSEIQSHPIRYIAKTFSCSVLIIMTTFALFMIATPAFRSMANAVIERMSAPKNQLNDLSNQLHEMERHVADTIVAQMNKVRNPKLEGIAVRTAPIKESTKVFTIISPVDTSRLGFGGDADYNDFIMSKIVDWAISQKYDSIIFGRSYVTAGGASLWTDGIHRDYDTDLEYLLEMVKKHDCQNTLAFIMGLDQTRVLPEPVTKSIQGQFIVRNMPIYKFRVCGYDFWNTEKVRTVFQADNFQAMITNGDADFTVLIGPGTSNEPKLLQVNEKKTVDSIRDYVKNSLITVSEKL